MHISNLKNVVYVLIFVILLMGCGLSSEKVSPEVEMVIRTPIATFSDIEGRGRLPAVEDMKVLPPLQPTATPQGEETSDPNFFAGKEAFKKGDFEEVLRLMNLVIEADPDFAPAYVYRGTIFANGAGIDDIEKAMILIPDYAFGLVHHGLSLYRSGDEAGGIRDNERALEIDPTLALAHHNIGASHVQHHEYSEAIYQYTVALTIDPTRSETWRNRGEVLAMLGMYEECVNNSNQAMENEIYWPFVFTLRGVCRIELGQFEEALDDLNAAIEGFKGDSLAWMERGRVYYHLGLFEKALSDMNQAITMFSGRPDYYVYRGLTYIELMNYDAARSDFDVALSYDLTQFSNFTLFSSDVGSLAYYGSGRVYFEEGAYENCVEELSRSIQEMPFTLSYFYRGLAYRNLGLVEQAKDDFKAFLQMEDGQYSDLEAEATAILKILDEE